MNAGHVYVLAFSDGTVKVGQTKDAEQRLSAHRSDARKFGLTVTDEWVSPLHAEWLANEADLKVLAVRLGGTSQRKEYFKGVEFSAVVEKAQELSFTAPGSSEDASAAVQWWAALKALLPYRIDREITFGATLNGSAADVVGGHAEALKDVLRWMAQIEAAHPELAST